MHIQLELLLILLQSLVDTPQNSPAKGGAKPKTTPNNFSPPNNSLNNNGIPQIANRQRRLSNSSMASDISFRLPSYDSPAVRTINILTLVTENNIKYF